MDGFKFIIGVLILAVLGIIIQPFLSGEIIHGHDTLSHLIFFHGFSKAFFEGQFPVRFIEGGYPGFNMAQFNFYPPMFYYLAMVPKLFGLSNTAAFNSTILSMWVLSGVFMYLFSKRHFGKTGGVVAAVFYLLVPYHLLQLFVRMALAEFTAAAFAPALFWAIDSKKPLLISIFTAAFLLSHNVTIIIFGPVILAYLFLKRDGLRAKFLGLLVGLGLSAFFLLPAFLETGFTYLANKTTAASDFHLHFVCFNQLFDPAWGFGGSVSGCVDLMSFQLGIAHWAILVIAGILLIITRKSLIAFFLLVTFFALFMTLPASAFIWEKVPYISFLQFPWRYLTLAAFAASFLAGAAASRRHLLAIFLLLLSIFCYARFASTPYTISESQVNFDNNNFLKGPEGELTPNYDHPDDFDSAWVKKQPKILDVPKNEVQVLTGKAEVLSSNLTTADKHYLLDVAEPAVARFYTHYFPGWFVKLNGQQIAFSYNNDFGYIDVNVPPGNQEVELVFGDTPIRSLANNISLFSLVFLLLSVFLSQLRRKKHP